MSGVQALLATRDTLKVSAKGIPVDTAPVTGSVRMSERLSNSSTKYGPSVSAAVRTQVALPVVGVLVEPPFELVSVVSVAFVAAAAQLASSDCETMTLAAPFAAKPSRSRRLRRVRGGITIPATLFDLL